MTTSPAPSARLTAEDVAAEPQVEALLRLKTRFAQAEAVGPKLRVFVPGATPQAARVQVEAQLEGLMVIEIQVAAPKLEDAFIALLQQRQLAGPDDARQTQVWLDGEPPKGDGIAIDRQSARALGVEAGQSVTHVARW